MCEVIGSVTVTVIGHRHYLTPFDCRKTVGARKMRYTISEMKIAVDSSQVKIIRVNQGYMDKQAMVVHQNCKFPQAIHGKNC